MPDRFPCLPVRFSLLKDQCPPSIIILSTPAPVKSKLLLQKSEQIETFRPKDPWRGHLGRKNWAPAPIMVFYPTHRPSETSPGSGWKGNVAFETAKLRIYPTQRPLIRPSGSESVALSSLRLRTYTQCAVSGLSLAQGLSQAGNCA